VRFSNKPPFLAFWIVAIWIVVGVAAAAIHDYYDSLETVDQVLTAIAAVLLWPLLLFGFDIQIS
jgi:hypothetical protein